jgi:hypothetical protein
MRDAQCQSWHNPENLKGRMLDSLYYSSMEGMSLEEHKAKSTLHATRVYILPGRCSLRASGDNHEPPLDSN